MPDIAIRSYRYSQLQKNELERLCMAMLALGIIHPSTSPFSGIVLLVKKADNTLCFYINFRTLNDKTCKEKVLIRWSTNSSTSWTMSSCSPS